MKPLPPLTAPVVISVSKCREGPTVCMVRVKHTIVEGANRYVIEGPASWSYSCGQDDDCTINFQVPDPPQKCTFTIRAGRGNELGPPSKSFCVPGSGD